jgi:threonine synthase
MRKAVLVRYDLESAAASLTKESLPGRQADLWRYREVLPVDRDENVVSLGEGFTPLVRASRLGQQLGLDRPVYQGRGAESDPEFQSAGHDRGGVDGQRAGCQETRSAIGW